MKSKIVIQTIGLILCLVGIIWIICYPKVEKGQYQTETEIATIETTYIRVTYWNPQALLLEFLGFLICLLAYAIDRYK
jgi:cbb3-type cytochrome oxidase subunit 3